MLIVNPTHVAVALRYDAKAMIAPTAVAVGVDRVALRYKRLALLYGIPIIEDRVLARALLRACRLNDFIPEACFPAVARHYNQLRRQAVPADTHSIHSDADHGSADDQDLRP